MTLPNRNNIIARMRKRGRTIPQIAAAIGCGESYVKDRLRDLGYAKQIKSQTPADEGIWGLPENKLRAAIARRAIAGARDALQSQTNAEHSLLST